MESPCKGGLEVSEKALLSMLGSEKFIKKPVVSYSELRVSEALALLDESNGDIGLAAAKSGMTKSSFKRLISSAVPSSDSYGESYPIGVSRKYLEGTFGKWKVAGFDPSTGSACVDMNNGTGVVRISVDVELPRNQY